MNTEKSPTKSIIKRLTDNSTTTITTQHNKATRSRELRQPTREQNRFRATRPSLT